MGKPTYETPIYKAWRPEMDERETDGREYGALDVRCTAKLWAAAIITCLTGKGEERTTATVYGSWAVHRGLGNDVKRWRITQVHTGLAIPNSQTDLLTKAQAIEAAKILDDAIGQRRVTKAIGKVAIQIIHRVMTRTKQTVE